MKPCLRFLLGAALALFGAAAVVHAQITPSGISASPGSAFPGDQVTFAVPVSNAGAVVNAGTADFSIVLTNITTGFSFTVARAGVPAVGQITAFTPGAGGAPGAPGTGTFNVTVTIPSTAAAGVYQGKIQAGPYRATVTMDNVSDGGAPLASPGPFSFANSSSVLTITGKPDLAITSLTYPAGTSYVGGDRIPMSLTYVNNQATNGTQNVPFVPGQTGFPSFVRIQVVLSTNPTFGDADDLQLTFHDIGVLVNADGAPHTLNWTQLLPGNYSGSYYVLAKIDSLNPPIGTLSQNDPQPLTVNGNNVWGGNTLNPSGTLINLVSSTFPTNFLASHTWTDEIPPHVPLPLAVTAAGYSDNPSMSSDSRFMAFASDADDLIQTSPKLDTNGVRDIFLFDSQTRLIRRVNLSQQGVQANAPSNNPAISSDGRDVSFESNASNMILGDNNGFSDIFVVNTLSGLISRVSVDSSGAQANNPSFKPGISQTGRYVVFQSTATNLVSPATVPGVSHIYLHDRDVANTGIFDTTGNTSTRIMDVTAANAAGNGNSIQAAISQDGAYVAFTSDATNLDPNFADTNGKRDVFVRNVAAGTTRRVSVANTSHAEGDADSQTPSLSSDGHYVAFASLATNLVAGDTNGVSDIFIYDTAAAVGSPVVRRMSVSSTGVEGYDPSGLGFQLGSINPTISADGRYVAFASLAANLSAGDANGQYQGNSATATATITGGGTLNTLTVNTGGIQYSQTSPPVVIIVGGGGSGGAATATVSAAGIVTGLTITNVGAGYATPPTVVIASDSNNALDVFVHDRDAAATGTFDSPGNIVTQMISVNPFGYQTSGLLSVPSTAASNIYPVISANGRFVAFPSDAENNAGLAFAATNLLPLDSNTLRDVFLFDRRTNALPNPATPPTVTITSPGNGSAVLVNTVIDPHTYPITASATTNIGVVASVQFYVNGTSIGTSTVFPYSQPWTPTAVGTYTLSALVTDSFGNLGVSPNVTVTVKAAPSVGLTSPVAGSSVTVSIAQTVTATAAASNPGATIANVQFFANGVSLGVPDTTAPYSASWTPGATGTYTLTAVATDTIGTQTTSPGVVVIVAAAGGGGSAPPPPSVSFSPNVPGSVSVNVPQQLTVLATAAATHSIANVQFFANGTSVGTATSFPYTVSWTPVNVGTYVVTAVATDDIGTQATATTSVTVAPSGSAPTVTINPALPGVVAVGRAQTISVDATTSVNFAIANVQFLANGVSIGTVTAFPYTVDWTPLTTGTYLIEAVATDNSGNRSAPATATVTVNPAPTATITAPAANASLTVGVAQTITATATAVSPAAMTSVQFFANGVSLGTDGSAPYSFAWTPVAVGSYALTAVALDNTGVTTTSTAVNVTVVAAGGGGGGGGSAGTLSPTGLTVTPGAALPGDTVTFAVSVSNSAVGGNFTGSADFTFLLTNLANGATFTITQVGISPAAFIPGATAAAPPAAAAPGVGTFNVTGTVPKFSTQAGSYRAQVTMSNVVGGSLGATASFGVTTGMLTITGLPDLQITNLTYPAGTSYVGGTVIPMSITYTNNDLTPGGNNKHNVPYVPTQNGDKANFFRIQVVLSSNPTYGDADDFQLTTFDVQSVVNADGAPHTLVWNQILPGNFSGSYYVLAKIDSLNTQPQNAAAPLTVNGDPVWGGNTLNPSGTLINLLPSNFPANFLATHAAGFANSANGYSDNPSLSSDGRYVAFASDAANLIAGDTNATRDIFLYDDQTTFVRRLSVSQQGAQGNAASNNPAISADGRYVAFGSEANNLVLGDTNGFSDIYVVDAITGLISRVSLTTLGAQANNPSFRPAISQTGRYIVFESTATNLDAAYTVVPGSSHIYLADRDVSGSGTYDTAGNTSTRLVDVDLAAPTTTVANAASIQAAISADGSLIAWASKGTNLVAGGTTATRQHVYVRARTDVGTATSGIKLISVVTGTAAEGDADSQTPSLTADGSWVAFASLATNLLGVGVDTNGVSDIFVYDNSTPPPVGSPIVRRMSVSSAGVQATDPSPAGFRLGSINPTISSDGRYVAFASLAANLSPGDAGGQFHDGAYATAAAAAPVAGALTTIAVTSGGSGYLTPPAVRISGGGGTGGYATAALTGGAVTSITVVNVGAGYTSTPTVALIADSGDTNNALDIFVHDRDALVTGVFDTGITVTQMVSVNTFGYQTAGLLGVPSTAASNIYPVISANGRFVAYPSDAENNAGLAFGATNLLPLDGNGVRDVFLFDRRTNAGITPATPPVVTITSPGNGGSVFVNTVIPVTASATTNVGVVSSVQFFVNGTSLGTSTVFPYSQPWTPTAVGTYRLSALVTDSFGNLGVSSNVTVTVNAAPSVGLTAPVDGSSIVVGTLTNVTATAAASNPGATITSVQFFANGVSLGTDLTAPYSAAWTPAVAGAYSLTAVATDSIGTQKTAPAVSVSVTPVGGGGGGGGGASPPPTVSLLSVPPPTAPVNVPISLTATATAANGFTVTGVQYFANGVSIGSAAAFPYTAAWIPAALGTYTITAVATDNVGTTGTSAGAAVTVIAGTAPTIPFTSPIAGASYAVGNPITVAATAALGSGLVKSVEFFANGVSIGTASGLPFSTTFTPAASGTYVFTAKGTDSSGNIVASTPVTVTVVGATAPTVAISSPANNASLPVNVPQKVTVSASSSTASLASVDLSINGVVLGIKTAFPYIFDWTPASEGTYSFIAVATDSQGAKTTSIPITVKVAAASPPTVSLVAPATGSSYPVGNPITVTANASSSATGLTITSVEFFANGASLGTKTASPYTLTWTPTAAGNYSLSAIATDTSGAQATSAPPIAVTIGLNAPPTISLTSPSAASTYALGTGVLLSASAGDSDGTVSSVRFFANGLLLSTATAAPYTFSWVPQASGTYQITASATDNSGNVVTTLQRAVTISAAASTTVSITNPTAGGSYPVGNAIPFVVGVTGGNGPITQVQFFVNGVSVGSKSGSPYVVPWNPAAAGTYSLLAVATDSAGISTNSSALSVTITANAPPIVTLTNPASGTSVNAGMLVSLTAAAFDSDGTVVSVNFLANGNIVATATAAPFFGTWIPSGAGAYSVVAQATDNSGNVTNSTPITINVFPNQSPTVALTSPISGSTVRVGGSVTLNATAGDVDGTVTNVQFFANGVSLGTDTTPPYAVQWAPTAAGIYRLIAVAFDNSGAVTTSATVIAIASTGAGDNSVTAGSYQGPGEVGNYAIVTAVGKTAVFIAYSTTPGLNKTYFYPGIPVDVSGGFNLNNASGVTLISGNVNATGTSATFDAGRLQFIGIDTIYLAGAGVVPARYYTGSLTGHAASALSAIVGADGSIMLYVADGAFIDAGGGGLGGKVSSTGTFSVTTVRGNRFTGTVDPSTGALTGTLSGANGGAFTGAPAILGVSTSAKVSGAGRVVQADIVAPNGNIYDQVLLQGAAATITADPGKITRVSYVDLTNDIVQVEFAGAGALSITLDNPSGPAAALNYNQPNVAYMKGHAGIVISGANESTNVSVFSVGRLTAFDPTGAFNVTLPIGSTNNPASNGSSLFQGHASTAYDGVADIAYLAILSIDGKFGGIRTANASYFATTGITGVLAPGVQFTGPVYVGDINAATNEASAMLLLGSASDVRITGGDLFQFNGKAVQVSGLSQLKFVSGVTSQGATLPAQTDRSRLEENGADVTARVVVNPGP